MPTDARPINWTVALNSIKENDNNSSEKGVVRYQQKGCVGKYKQAHR